MVVRLSALPVLGILLVFGACSNDRPEANAADEVGLESTSDTETDEGPPACDFDALHACNDAARDAHATCSMPCPETLLSCAEADCSAGCELERAAAELDCLSAHCIEPPDEIDMCMHACWSDMSSCLAAGSCDLHGCQWEVGGCLSACYECILPIELDFAFMGACELVLPETIDPVLVSFAHIEIADQSLYIDVDIAACIDNPEMGAMLEDDTLTLCPSSCAAFEAAGLLRAVFGGPCGP